jgi:glc operon protein GlcG
MSSYGISVNLEQAKKVLDGAETEARKQGWNVCIAVVDISGNLVAFLKIDDTQNASVQVSQDKARTAVLYKRPTKFFQDAVAAGGAGIRVMGMRDVCPAEGGIPLIADGKIIGGVGVSGVNSDQDAMVATAGANMLTK